MKRGLVAVPLLMLLIAEVAWADRGTHCVIRTESGAIAVSVPERSTGFAATLTLTQRGRTPQIALLKSHQARTLSDHVTMALARLSSTPAGQTEEIGSVECYDVGKTIRVATMSAGDGHFVLVGVFESDRSDGAAIALTAKHGLTLSVALAKASR